MTENDTRYWNDKLIKYENYFFKIQGNIFLHKAIYI